MTGAKADVEAVDEEDVEIEDVAEAAEEAAEEIDLKENMNERK